MTNVLGILPLRAGSKGLPKKNTKKMLGKPLFAWAADALIGAQNLHFSVCSTENKNIALAAENRGLNVPFLRPKALASDTAKISDVLIYTLDKIKETTGEVYTHVALVQATSPCVLPFDIDRAVELALENDADTVISVFKAEHTHPHLMFRQTGKGDLKWLISEQSHQSRRQDERKFISERDWFMLSRLMCFK